jgi:hypothetical protein
MNDAARVVAEHLRLQGAGCEHMGSAFYGALLAVMADDVEAGGPVWTLLEPHAEESFDAAYRLRLLAGVHRMVLSGAAPALASHFPTTGGDGDVGAMWPEYRDLLAARPETVLDALRRPPQTNEVGRSAALAGGLAVVAQRTERPLRLLEMGTSAGLNLRLDRYWYEQDGMSWGERAAAVRFVDLWAPTRPPFEAGAVIAMRRGCDRDPIDATAEDAPLTLLAYVWPGQDARFRTLRDALEIAAAFPVTVDRADAVEWLPAQLGESHEWHRGRATVVMHSVFWQYVPNAAQESIVSSLKVAGERATAATPLAWLRLEPSSRGTALELRLTMWPGGAEERLATSGFHAGPVEWRD